MKIKILFAPFFIFLFCAVIQAQNSNVATNGYFQNKQVVEAPKTTVFGRVLYEDTGKPVRRGAIYLLKIPVSGEDGQNETYGSLDTVYNSKTVTNESGEFKMEDIAAGEYYPYIDVAGVLNPNTYDDFFKDGTKISTAKLDTFFQKISIIEGVKEIPALIRVKRGGAIGGRILYADGEPVINMKVEILRKGDSVFENKSRSSSYTQQSTDDRGVYRFPGLPPGEYTVRIIEPSINSKTNYYNSETSELKTYYGDTAKATEAKTIELALGEEKSEINITVPDRKTFKITGVVIGKTSKKPIPKARISFSRTDDESILSYQLKTNSSIDSSDEKGQWSAIDLPAGTYTFTISPPNEYLSEEELKKRKNEPRFAEAKKEIVLDDKDLEGVVFELPIAAKISGTVVFEDKREIKNLFLYVYDEEKEIFKTINFNENTDEQDKKTGQTQWNFVLSNVSEGNYFVNVISFAGQGDFYVKSIKSGSADLESAPLQVKEGDEINDIQIVLATDMGTLKGKVEIDDAKALKGMSVIIVSVDKLKARTLMKGAEINKEGDFQLKAAPGEYYVIAQSGNIFRESYRLKRDEWIRKFTKDAEKVKIKAGETQTVTIKKNL